MMADVTAAIDFPMPDGNAISEGGSAVWSARPSPRAEATLCALLARADIRCDGGRPWDLRVNDARFHQRVLAQGTLGFGEAYMDGWWDCDALDEMIFRATRARLDEHATLDARTALTVAASVVLNLQTRARARHVARRHYDLGNEFFAAMLDPTMQYSCARFDGTDDLAEAQRRKLDLICRKLGLQPGMRLLDIGCGWGGLAKHAARHHGCEVVGITISREQRNYAAEACRGLPVEIRLQDYRDLAERFDRIVSVGMLEHVGGKNYRRYMEVAHRSLAEDGLFLCHSIAGNAARAHTDPWITKYIFPNSMLPSAAQVSRAAEGLFVLEDVHGFGADYDRTLLAWERNFSRSWDQFRERYGERFRRMWRYYLLSCAGAFRARTMQVFQFLFSKHGIVGGWPSVR
jgi:cyclopropane-fatty-acyl-phospholipid synthase